MAAVGRSGHDIAGRVGLALLLKQDFGEILLNDKELKTFLIRLDRNTEATQKEMMSAGATAECADCAVNGEGTCCGTRTGYKCDSVLLLINLLLGRSLPSRPYYHDMCYFLTKEGCALRVRHVICINFLCRRLRKNVPYQKLVRLQEIAGAEMDTLFNVEEYIKKKLGTQTLNQYRSVV